ncbi:hypothetical protein [Meiothermus hypogaeus]|uniref:DUF11 domain-containing protein n=2 Tax=Meiothermus hypogaeus TaxID=884155 RepID=A0A511R1V1_9DEIN|nr:hypothetical protein [Meiothermus hypogaeus]RIH77024.1 hypothetical protein Mhypo_02196 [Meiothermus hypogaeus]GEM83579.1 hypothetical protein MHY01S_17450 [Meiothermus hypogaeus NBRC 106114]
MKGTGLRAQAILHPGVLLALSFWLLAFGGIALAQARTDLRGIVPGDRLGWEIQELRASVVVSKPTLLNLQIYSPGFDPNDYRRALRGQEELGDERYDRGQGKMVAQFMLSRDGQILAQQTYQVEPHRWVLFFRGPVEPGVYQLSSRLLGLGKNAFRYRIQTSVPGAAELLVDPTLQLYDVRQFQIGNPLSVTTIKGQDWLEPFVLNVSPGVLPLRVGFYDEDGAKEMEGRVRLPDGRIEPREVSGDRDWAYYDIRQPGVITFGFRQPKTATQYSNTIGFRVDACMEVEQNAFRVVAPRPVTASAVDSEGRPLNVPIATEGDKIRTLTLSTMPEGYRLVRVEVQGGERLGNQSVRFGCAGGQVRFVLEKIAPPEPAPTPLATLEVEAVLVLPDGEQPLDLKVQVGEQEITLNQGRASQQLTPGGFKLTPQLSGARMVGPASVVLEGGQTQRVRFLVYPEVELSLEAAPTTLRVGEQTTLTARVSTAFPRLLPADLELLLPPCLEALGATRLTAPVAQGRDAVLQIQARATCKAEPVVKAALSPWQQEASAGLRILQPATFTLRKEALTPSVLAGGEATWRLRVQNTGDEAGRVRLQDNLAAGLQGSPLDQTLELQAGEERVLEVRARVAPDAPATLTNTARLLNEQNQPLAQARAEVQVLRPVAELSRTLDKRMVIPGEVVEVQLKVHNSGQAPLTYTLQDTYPEWLEVAQSPAFSGMLAPGASTTHTYRAQVRFGAPAEGSFLARLSSNGGDKTAPDRLQRTLLQLEKTVEPARVLVGSPVTFTLRVGNPTDHPVTLELQESPDEGLKMQLPNSLRFTLGAGEVRELRLEAEAGRVGLLENQVTTLVNGVTASFPAKAILTALPLMEPLRLSTIHLDFNVQSTITGERLLLTHLPPNPAAYEPGSARLDGKPIPDPRIDEAGRLFFELPYQTQGVFSYQLRHREGLGPIAEPTLTLRLADREVYLQGQQSYASFEKARPLQAQSREGFIQEPLPGTLFRVDKARVVLQTPYGLETRLSLNGQPVDSKNLGQATYDTGKGLQRLEYYGLPLQPGRNLIEVQTAAGSDRVEVFLTGNPTWLEVRPLRLLADGRTPIELEIRALDALGLPAGFGAVTVETSIEPTEPDAFPLLSGYQLLLKDGQALLRLKPTPTPTSLRLRLAFDELEGQAEFFVLGRQNRLWQFQGSVGIRLGESIQVFGLGRGYLESPLAAGTLRAALDGSLHFNQGQPQVESGLRDLPDPTGSFPLTGAGNEAQWPLRSDDPVALRYDQEGFGLGYYADQLSVFGLSGLPQGTALRIETRDDLALQGFAGWLPVNSKTDLIVPDGTRFYRLSGPAEPGSEQVVLLVGASERPLERLKDYVLDATSGTLTLAEPLWPSAPNFQPVRLRVVYAPLGSARELGYGAGARWRTGDFSIGAGVAYLPGNGWRYGAEAAYQLPGFGLRATYSRGSFERLGLELSGKNGPLESSANLTYEGKLQGQAQVAYSLSETDRVSLEHQTAEANRTGLLYTRRLSPAFSVGAGLGYTWESGTTLALGRLGLESGALRSELTHAQPFSLTESAFTRLHSTLALDVNLSAEAELTQTWGLGLSGNLGLKQKLGGANLSLAYQLPGASGEGNRARFGLEAPLPLSDSWSLNASAGYERSLSTGSDQLAFGLALRYQAENFAATLGGETAWAAGQPKVVLRAGATGQLDAQQSLALDANYQLVPTLEGRFTLAYALRGREVSLLTYHRLSSGTERVLEGALAASYQPDLAFQLRPSLAYRLKLDDPAGHTYQLGLGGNYYFTDWLGLGAAAYYQLQPGTQSSATAFSLEASFRVVEGLWFNAGYTFGGFVGPTPDTTPGFYLRLDILGGGR